MNIFPPGPKKIKARIRSYERRLQDVPSLPEAQTGWTLLSSVLQRVLGSSAGSWTTQTQVEYVGTIVDGPGDAGEVQLRPSHGHEA
jgi:hypothetical protein